MANAIASKTVVGVFNNIADAQNVVRDLENVGFLREDISIVANQQLHGADQTTTSGDLPAGGTSDVATDAGIGAALGGVGGLLLGFAGLAVPGIGPVLAIGPIVAALSGAGIGAVAGGIIGALTESGVPEAEALHYAESVRRGDVLVTVRTASENSAEQARGIMDSSGAVDVEQRAGEWRQRGWNGYEPGAEPLSADELRREREYYAQFEKQGDEWIREEKLVQHQTGSAPEGGTLPRTNWPHPDAHDAAESLAQAEPSNAAGDLQRAAREAIEPEASALPSVRGTARVYGKV